MQTKFWVLILTLSLLITSFSLISNAQISQPGKPLSFLLSQNDVALNSLDFEVMPTFDVEALRNEDAIIDPLRDRPWRFGQNIDVNLNYRNSGKWDYLEGGQKVWRLGITSRGAVSLNLLFENYNLPPDARLFIYTPDLQHILGAFTDSNNQPDGVFATTLLPGESIIIEYNEPSEAEFEGQFSLVRVTHGYRGPLDYGRAFGGSGSCNVNVACPQSAGMEDQIRSAAMLVSGGSGFCSGALINNTANNGTPYFLTADHCFSNPSSVVFWFNWQSATCLNPPSSPPYQSVSGAATRARYSASDVWLLELNQAPPSNYNVYYSGWNRTTDNYINGKVWGIHHPSGDIKKISWSDLGVSTTSYLQNPVPGNGSHWRVTQWSDGTTTEGGSSGSPLYDPQGRIIGQLHGGYASCTSLTSDWYGKLGVSWTGGGTNTTRLSNWLDPLNTGATTLEGYDPNQTACTPPANQASNFSASVIEDEQMTINWTRGNGTSVLVVARQGSAVTTNPSNGINYTANAAFGSGNEIGTGNYVVYKGTGATVSVTNLQPGTSYHLAIYEFFTADNCYKTPALTGNATTSGTAPCTYCVPTATTNDNTGITSVQFNTINNTSTGAPAYTDFTHLSTTVMRGQSYNLSVRVNTDGNYTVYTRAWFDWDKSCTFNDATESYALGSATNVTNGLTSNSPLTITIPEDAEPGQTTLRIRAVWNVTSPGACGNHNYSEAEDYTINILSSSVFANFAANPTSIQVDESVTFTDASGGGAITSWNWNFGAGASPATATGQGPHVVTYNTTGQKTISLAINGNITETKTDYISVAPDCTVSELPFVESFETSFPPTCWSLQSQATNTWAQTSSFSTDGSNPVTVIPQDGDYFTYVQWQVADQDEWLISPPFDFSDISEPQISFWFNGSYHWAVIENTCDLDLMIRVNNGNWTKIWGETDHPEFTSNDVNYIWLNTILPLAVYQGQAKVEFAFRYTGNDGANFAVDQITITANECDSPSVGGIISPAITNLCEGNNSVSLSLSDYDGQIVTWQSSVDENQWYDIIHTEEVLLISNLEETTWFRTVVQNTGCVPAFSETAVIQVHLIPELNCISDTLLCIDNNPFELSGSIPEGGVYSGPGVVEGVFYPSIAGAGDHSIFYFFNDPVSSCSNTCTFSITVVSPPADFSLCQNADPTLLYGGLPEVGIYTGPAVEDGYFYPEIAGPGIHQLFYTINPEINNPSLIAYWNFNEGTNGTPWHAPINASFGSGQLTQGSWTWGNTSFTNGFAGSSVNALLSDPAGASLSLISQAMNGQYIQLQFSMENRSNLVISYWTRRTTTGFNSNQWSFSIDGESFHDFGQSINPADDTGGELITVNAPEFINSTPVVYLRYTLNGASSNSGNNRIDNLRLSATTHIAHTCSFNVTVHPLPTVVCPDDLNFCISEEAFELFHASPPGGTYQGTGVVNNQFDPVLAGAGTHNIIYTYADQHGCLAYCEFSITVHELPPIDCPEYGPFTQGEEAIIFTEPGDFSMDGQAVFSFFPESTGLFTFTYTVIDSWGCESSCEFVIQVLPELGVPESNLIEDFIIFPEEIVCFDAIGTITVVNTIIQAGAIVEFRAGEKIFFLNGFIAESQSNLHALITFNFCTQPTSLLSVAYIAGSDETTILPQPSGFKIYPNPSGGKLTINLGEPEPQSEASIMIFNTIGELILSKRISGSTMFETDLSERPAGIYLIRISTFNKTETLRLIKL